MPPGAPPLVLVAYRCDRCGQTSQVNEGELARRRQYANQMRSIIGSYRCEYDERVICSHCRPGFGPDETKLDDGDGAGDWHRLAITHVRRPVRRVVWIKDTKLHSLEATLLGRKDGELLTRGGGALGNWWRELRAELDGDEPDLGHELGVWPRTLDFGRLFDDPVVRPLHLLNPTDRPAVFRLTSNITTGDPGRHARPPHFEYRVVCSPALEAARRGGDLFEVAPRSRLIVEIAAQPWARESQFRQFEIWATPVGEKAVYLGTVKYEHTP